jgi:O-antigen ligase
MSMAIPLRTAHSFTYQTEAIGPSLRSMPEFSFLLTVCWVLAMTCLSTPGRGGPLDMGSVDLIALGKIAARGGSLLGLGVILFRLHDHLRIGPTLARLFPFLLFACWCVTSFLWSNLKAVSFGHAIEVFTLVLLSIVTAALCSSEECIDSILRNLFLTSLVLCVAILLLEFHAIAAGERPSGYMHPNTLGAVSGTGSVVLIGSRLLWKWPWTQTFWWPGLGICFGTLYVARSRSSLLATFLVLAILFVVRRQLLLLTVVVALAGILMALFPYVDVINKVPDRVVTYILRGQTSQDLMEGSGRDELWAIALESFKHAPWFGHGYFTITSSGSLFVWKKQQFQTAHNLGLHLLTGTGIFGTALFLWGIGAALKPCFQYWRDMSRDRAVEFFGLLILVWFMVLGAFEISILGPLDPAVVLFFMAVGIVVGNSVTRELAA